MAEICSGVSGDPTGGMRKPCFSDETRRTSLLSALLPGRITGPELSAGERGGAVIQA